MFVYRESNDPAGAIVAAFVVQQHKINPAYNQQAHGGLPEEIPNPEYNAARFVPNPKRIKEPLSDDDKRALKPEDKTPSAIENPDFRVDVPPRIPNPAYTPATIPDPDCMAIADDAPELVAFLERSHEGG